MSYLHLLQTPVTELFDLSTRLTNVCFYENIVTLEEFAKTTEFTWLHLPNCHKVTLKEVREHLATVGMHVGMSNDELRDRFSADHYFIHEDYT